MAWEGMALSAGANLIGGFLQQSGANDRNNAQIGAAREQMAFQERMSNTAYQRAMADMRAAGLNPILAYQKGGASTPGGAMPNLENPNGGWGPALAGSVNSAREAYQTKHAVDNTQQDTQKKSAETDVQRATVDLTKATEQKAKVDTITSATQAELNNAQAQYAKENTLNAALNNVILGHEGTVAERRAFDAKNYGSGREGQTASTVEHVLKRLFGTVAPGGGSGSPVPTPTVPSSKEPIHPLDIHGRMRRWMKLD